MAWHARQLYQATTLPSTFAAKQSSPPVAVEALLHLVTQ
jgi:hypothetical protein